MEFNTSLTSTLPKAQSIGFGKIVPVCPSAQLECMLQTHVKFIPTTTSKFPSFFLSQTVLTYG